MLEFFRAFKNACRRTYLPSELPKELMGTQNALAHSGNEFFHAVGKDWKDNQAYKARRLVLIGNVERAQKKSTIHSMAALATPLMENGNRLVRLSYHDGFVRLEVLTHEEEDADDFAPNLIDDEVMDGRGQHPAHADYSAEETSRGSHAAFAGEQVEDDIRGASEIPHHKSHQG